MGTCGKVSSGAEMAFSNSGVSSDGWDTCEAADMPVL
jgi:hypothetical protein